MPHKTTHQKHFGVVYTPRPIVNYMLDMMFEKPIGDSAICDPACGDGEFLVPLAERLCKEIKNTATQRKQYIQTLKKLTGFDIDDTALSQCKQRLDNLLVQYSIPSIEWNLHKIDATNAEEWGHLSGKYDFLVGNPPYVRVQHLEKYRRSRIKSGDWRFMKGACDLYLLFFDMSLRLLSRNGTLVFITPRSWLNSATGKLFRDYLRNNHQVKSIHDFGDYQIFPNVTTYTAITVIEKPKKNQKKIPVQKFTGYKQGVPNFVNGSYIFPADNKWRVQSLKERDNFDRLSLSYLRLGQVAEIKVGIQTLADKVFIFPKGEVDIEIESTKPIYKASVMKNDEDPIERVIIYPYEDGRLMSECKLRERFPKAYRWLLNHKEKLLARDKGTFDENHWYAYGRPVGIVSGFGEKILTSSMNPKPNFQYCSNPDALFYSGYCIKPKQGISTDKLLECLNSPLMEEFIRINSSPFMNGWFSYSKSVIQDYPIKSYPATRDLFNVS